MNIEKRCNVYELFLFCSLDSALHGVERFIPHELYKPGKRKGEGISEDYEYDVALIQLKTSVKLSPSLR